MTQESMKKVKDLCKEMLELIKEVEVAEKPVYQEWAKREISYPSGINRATLKRRSMDLTRALAQLRKP